MDLQQIPTQRLTRGKKRAAEGEEARRHEEELLNKRKRNTFRTRRVASSCSGGMTLIGRNDIITDPKNPTKILIPEETGVKPEIKEEESPLEEETQVERSKTGFQDLLPVKQEVELVEDDVVGVPDQIGEVEVAEVTNIQMDSHVDWSRIMKEELGEERPSRVKCTRCLDLEKSLQDSDKRQDGKDLAIRKLEETIKSQTEQIQDLKMRLEAAEDAALKTDDETGCSVNHNEDNLDAVAVDCTNPVFRAISNGKSMDEIESPVAIGDDWKDANECGDSVLHVAARIGNLEAVTYFISIGAQVNARNSFGSTPLMEAAKSKENFVKVVELLIGNGADVKATNESGENALCIALKARKSYEELKKFWSSEDKRFNVCLRSTTDQNENTVLHKAAASGDLEALKYYMSLKPDVSIRNADGLTPLDCAIVADAKQNFSSIIDLLLINGANINSRRNTMSLAIKIRKPMNDIEKLVHVGLFWNRDLILFDCFNYGYVEALKYFIKVGANVNAYDKSRNGWSSSGWTPLMEAMRREMNEIVELLIENGAKSLDGIRLSVSTLQDQVLEKPRPIKTLEILSKHGVTWDDQVLHHFVDKDNLEAIRYCVQKGANVNVKSFGGQTPLVRAALACEPNLEILDFLVAKGANVNEVDEDGFSIIHQATPGRSLAVIKKLVSLGAIWSSGVVGKETRKESILHAAVRGGRLHVVQFIMSKGVDVNARDFRDRTPLLLAARECGEEILEILRVLVKGGADPNARDSEGNTALHLAVDECLASYSALSTTHEIVKVLVRRGCDWRLPNKKGETVISKLEGSKKNSKLLKYFKHFD